MKVLSFWQLLKLKWDSMEESLNAQHYLRYRDSNITLQFI